MSTPHFEQRYVGHEPLSSFRLMAERAHEELRRLSLERIRSSPPGALVLVDVSTGEIIPVDDGRSDAGRSEPDQQPRARWPWPIRHSSS